MTISIIAAIASNGVIGLNGGIPWHIREDMAYFKRVTMGHRVIMGSNTFRSLPNFKLDGRECVVISKKLNPMGYVPGQLNVVQSVEEALALPQWGEHKEVFCIGGAKLYKAMLPLANKLYLTEIKQEFTGDIYFPEYNKSDWYITSEEHNISKDGISYTFSTYKRNLRKPLSSS